MTSRLADDVPPMSAEAFESGRKRPLTQHRWVVARRCSRSWPRAGFLALGVARDREMTWTWWQHVYGDACTWVAIGLLVALATTRQGLSSAAPARLRGWTPRSRS